MFKRINDDIEIGVITNNDESSSDVAIELLKLRYKIFTEDAQYIMKYNAFKIEFDEYDTIDTTIHLYVKHIPTNTIFGYARLIKNNNEGLPTLKNITYDGSILTEKGISGFFDYDLYEISRVCISKERLNGIELSIHPALAVFIAIIRASKDISAKNWISGMEPRLNRLLKRFGLDFQKIGEVQNYHGKRAPYLGEIKKILERVKNEYPEVHKLL